ncbi:MAG: hypothetical protein QOJ59_1054 [Thermomicrobiales bacterium]|nr:hypothetical protein [Thermomicrobiales bacterium]
MDGPRFAALARPRSTATPALSRRTMLRGVAGLTGGLAAASLIPGGWSSSPMRAAAASPQIVPASLGNPAARILLPGEAGLTDYGLDFALSGPPAVFVSPGDTPGWSDELRASVGGFAFGYAATLAAPHRDTGNTGRAVQVCVHHGFPSTGDADVAWSNLTTALAGRGEARKAKVKSIDLVEIVEVDGPRTILATVAADRFDAIVVALRAGADLVTVAIADFTGKRPTQDEAVLLAENEADKIKRPQHDRSTVAGAYNGTWTPGFGFGASGAAIAGAPFFAWPTVLRNAPVPFHGEAPDHADQRRQTSSGVQYQSHVEGPFTGAPSIFTNHGLYYSGQTSFFGKSGDAKNFHEETSTRLKIGLPGVKLTKIQVSATERRYTYRVTTAIGTLCGLVLNRIVRDADFPLGFTLHVLTVPGSPDTKAIATGHLRDRLDPVIREMADSLEVALLVPDSAPLTIGVSAPI